MFTKYMTLKKLILLIMCLSILVLVTIAYAETKSDSTWYRSTYVSGSNVYSLTTSSTMRYYYDVNLRAWGASPNPFKEEDYRYCYNCNGPSVADVSNVYYGIRPSRHSYVVYNGGITTYDYTSDSGGQSYYACWVGGSPC